MRGGGAGEKESGEEARSGGSHPLASPPPRDCGTRDHLGLICRTETLRFFSGSHPSRLPLPAPLLPSTQVPSLSLAAFSPAPPSPPINRENPVALLSSSSFHLLSIQTRETLTNTLPMIYSAVSEERRARSSIDRSLPPFSISSHSYLAFVCSSRRFISRFLSFSYRGERGERWKRR